MSDAKIREEIFVGPQIRTIFKDSTFKGRLNKMKKRA